MASKRQTTPDTPATRLPAAILFSAIALANDPKPLGRMQEIARSMFAGFLDGGTASVSITPEDLDFGPASIRGLRVDVRRGSAGIPQVEADGSPIAWFGLHLAFALASAHGARLSRCPDEKCGKFFVRVGKKKYCSASCSHRVWMRNDYEQSRNALARKKRGNR